MMKVEDEVLPIFMYSMIYMDFTSLSKNYEDFVIYKDLVILGKLCIVIIVHIMNSNLTKYD